MTEPYPAAAARVIEEAQRIQALLLERCDFETRVLLNLADIAIAPCGCPAKATLTVVCRSREIAEAIGIRHAAIKAVLKQVAGCDVAMTVHYNIPEGAVFFDTAGDVAPARWYLCNRREMGRRSIPLPG